MKNSYISKVYLLLFYFVLVIAIFFYKAEDCSLIEVIINEQHTILGRPFQAKKSVCSKYPKTSLISASLILTQKKTYSSTDMYRYWTWSVVGWRIQIQRLLSFTLQESQIICGWLKMEWKCRCQHDFMPEMWTKTFLHFSSFEEKKTEIGQKF